MVSRAPLKVSASTPCFFTRDADDYERVLAEDSVDIVGLAAELAPGRPVGVVLRHADGRADEVTTMHTMSDEHIAWFKAGSALNLLRQRLVDDASG